MKNKIWIYPLVASMMISMISPIHIQANSYEGHESEWLSKCSTAQPTAADAQACSDFKDYYTNKMNELNNQVDDMEQTVAQLEADMSNIATVVQNLNAQIDDLNNQIAVAEESIRVAQENIILLDAQMVEKQKEIDKLDEQIKARMISEQANIGTNRIVDVVMGASSVVDLIRMITGLSQITANDQDQIDEAAVARAELKLQQDEQKRLQDDVEVQIANNEKLKDAAEEGKKQQESLYAQYQKEQANIMDRMMAAQTDVSAIAGNIAGINTNIRDDIFTPDGGNSGGDGDNGGSDGGNGGGGSGNNGWVRPVSYGVNPYAGTWHYSGGATHLGADYSGPIGGYVYAPADSIVLFAKNGFPSNGGFIGNMIGWPYGAANSIHLLTQVNGTTYGISFFHLANEGFNVRAGQYVTQGQVIALTGNSGNSTGAHCHIEVVNLGNMSVTQAQARFSSSGADFAWGLGWGDAALNGTCEAKGWATPCRERPESIF